MYLEEGNFDNYFPEKERIRKNKNKCTQAQIQNRMVKSLTHLLKHP